MKILVMTLGSRGDVQPYLALSKKLMQAGHSVSFCTCARFEKDAVSLGLAFFPLRNDILDFMETSQGRSVMEETTNVFKVIQTAFVLRKLMRPVQQNVIEDCWQAVEAVRPDVIVYHPKTFGVPSFAEKIGACAVLLSPFPAFVPTSQFAGAGFPNWPLGPWYNRFTYWVTKVIFQKMAKSYVMAWRKQYAPAQLRQGFDLVKTPKGDIIPVLHAYSAHVVPRPSDWPDDSYVSGYCFLDAAESWHPPADLQAFLAAGPPPVYVGFGSMAGKDPRKLTRMVLQALEKAGCRGVLATSWGGLEVGDLPETVFALKEAPHDWLFPRVSAVVHHGGAGTTAAGLRAGKPTIICPFFGDQPFWGKVVKGLGVGTAPLPQKKMTSAGLAARLAEVLQNQAIGQRAEELAELIRPEDGNLQAVQIIEKFGQTHLTRHK